MDIAHAGYTTWVVAVSNSTTLSRYMSEHDVRESYCGEPVVAMLVHMLSTSSYPKTIRTDQGNKFFSRDVDL